MTTAKSRLGEEGLAMPAIHLASLEAESGGSQVHGLPAIQTGVQNEDGGGLRMWLSRRVLACERP